MLLVDWLLVAALVIGLWVVLLRRLRGGEAVPAGSDGRMLGRKKKDDWGPTS